MKIKSIFVVMLMSLLVLGGCSNSSSDNGKKVTRLIMVRNKNYKFQQQQV